MKKSLNNIFLLFLFLIVSIFCSFKIRTSHPRVFLNAENLNEIRSTVLNHTEYVQIVKYVDRRIAEMEATVKTITTSSYPQTIMENTCFVALISQDSYYINIAISLLMNLTTVDPDVEWDTGTRYRLLCMAIGYDWLFPYLTTTQKTSLRNSMYNHLVRCEEFYKTPNFVGGHSKLGNLVILAACISLFEEDSRFTPVLNLTIFNWVNGYNPVMKYTGDEGGHYMSFAYSVPYSRIEALYLWYFATTDNEIWTPGFFYQYPLNYIYAANKLDKLPPFGDCYSTSLLSMNTVSYFAASSGVMKNPFAERFFRDRLESAWEAHQLFRMIFVKDAVEPVTHEQFVSLPLARSFDGSGFFIARNTFEKTIDPVIMTFKSTPYRNMNHHHFDQNSFTLDYKGPLFCDSGSYDSYGSNHFWNYYIRTIAHNSLLVFENGEDSFRGKSNDGGQIVSANAINVEELKSPEFRMDGIVEKGVHERFSWVRGDASLAYSSKIKKFTRDMIFIQKLEDYQLPVIIVVDRVELGKSLLTPKILFHVPTAPEGVDGKYHVSNIDGTGFARLEVLSPVIDGAVGSISFVHGDEKFVVDGTDYPPSKWDVEEQKTWGRIEVTSSLMNVENKHTYVSTIIVGDQKVTNTEVEYSKLVFKNEKYVAVKVSQGSYVVVSNDQSSELFYIQDFGNFAIKEIFVVGGVKGGCVTVKIESFPGAVLDFGIKTSVEGIGRYDVRKGGDDECGEISKIIKILIFFVVVMCLL